MELFLVLYLLWAFLASLIISEVAKENGRGGGSWFVISFVFSPFFAALCLAAMPDKREEEWRAAVLQALTPGSTIGDRLPRS